MNPATTTESGNPFPGLRPFREGEEHLFFGRENQVDTMIDKLARARFLAVVGTSGSGKSSLVNCGLNPALHRGLMSKAGTSWRMAQFRPGRNPIRAMAHALAESGVLFSKAQSSQIPLEDMVEATLRLSKLGLIDIYQQAQLGEGVNLLLVVDQFEELFRYQTLGGSAADGQSRNEEATAFVNLLLEPKGQPDVPIYIVLTMRSDFLGDCAEFSGLPEAINESQYLVPRMTREERRAAIASPEQESGGEISPVLLTRLVNDVGDNPDQLSILQHALNRTWARWQHDGQGEGSMSLPHYKAIGTMAHALDQHAEKAYGELQSDRQRKICEKIFKALTDKGTDARGIRRPTTLKILALVADASPQEVIQVVDVFRKPSRSFLMPPLSEALEPDTVIDISHESLMRVWERLKTWADEEAQSAGTYHRLAETAQLHAADKAGLWRNPDLQLALDWQQKEQPTAAWAAFYGGDFESAMAFLEHSKAEHDQEIAEGEFGRNWHTPWFLIVAIILVLFLLNHEKHSRFIIDFLFPKHDKPGNSLKSLQAMCATTLVGIPYFLTYLALAHYGKRVYRRIAFKSILRGVAANRGKASDDRKRRTDVEAVVALETSYATFWRRWLATVIDLVIFNGAFICAFYLFDLLSKVAPRQSDLFVSIMYGAWVVFGWLYQALTLSSGRQATPGMRATGIMLTDKNGNRLPFPRATARYFIVIVHYSLVLAALLAVFILMWGNSGWGLTIFIGLLLLSLTGFILPVITKRKQSIHDLIAQTVLLRRPRKVEQSVGAISVSPEIAAQNAA